MYCSLQIRPIFPCGTSTPTSLPTEGRAHNESAGLAYTLHWHQGGYAAWANLAVYRAFLPRQFANMSAGKAVQKYKFCQSFMEN